jgi:hypothetical protein
MTKPTPPNLYDFVSRDHDETSLLTALLADPATARLLVAWRKSVQNLEAARATAAAAGDQDLLDWLEGWDVRVSGDDP